MFTAIANTRRRFASEVDLSLMRGKHEIISGYLSEVITPLITLLILLSWAWSAQAAICSATSVSTFNACKASVNPGDEIVFPDGT